MNKIYGAIVLFIVTIALCVSENVFISNISDVSKNQITEIQKDVENNRINVALELIKELKSRWKEGMSILGILCDHRDIDRIEESINLIEVSLNNNRATEEFWAKCREAYLQLENLQENQNISLVNIL